MSMADQDLSEKEIRSVQAYRQKGKISAYRKIGVRVNQAVGDASYGHRGLSALSKQLGEGFSPEALQHCRRLARYWTREDAADADRAGVSLNKAIALLALDGLADRYPQRAGDLKTLRRSLVKQFGAREIDAAKMLAEAAEAKLKVLRGSDSGARRKSLFDGAKVLGTLLTQAKKRLEQDRALMPKACRPHASNLARQAEKLKVDFAALYAISLKEPPP